MKKKNENTISEQDINYNVYNALNLINEELGENYVETGFNPFEEGFELNESYIFEILKSQKEAEDLLSPEFINDGPNATVKAFEKSLKCSATALAKLEALLNDPRIPNVQKRKIQKIIEYIKMRIQMLEIEIKKLKKKESQNALEMYQQINALNWLYYKDFEESFVEEEFDIMQHLDNLLDLTPEIENPREVLRDLKEDVHEVLNELDLNKEEIHEIKQEIKEEVQDFIQDVKSGKSIEESARELYSDVGKIVKSAVKEDEGMSR